MNKVAYTVEEIGKMLGISRTKAYQLTKSELKVIRIGRCVRIPAEQLNEWVKRQIAV